MIIQWVRHAEIDAALAAGWRFCHQRASHHTIRAVLMWRDEGVGRV